MSEVGNPPVDLVLDDVARDECFELLKTQSVGRLAVADHGYYPPHIVPVNFTVDGDTIVFRSDAGLKFRLSVLSEHSVSFEVDSVDREGHMAWSVVVQGRAELLRQDEIDAMTYGAWLQPWAPGARPEWVRIVPYTITGRQLREVPRRAATST
jgi:uncharacterized protein